MPPLRSSPASQLDARARGRRRTISGVPTLLFVAAHPDDEVFGVSRSVAIHAHDPDFRFVLVQATDGEAGEIAVDVDVTRDQLGAVRRRETVDSWEVVGRQPDRLVWLGLPDGGLARLEDGVLFEAIGRILDEERPDVVATFGPDGVSGHPDHIMVGKATTEAFLQRVGDGEPGMRRLVHGAIPQSWVDRWNRRRREAGLWEWDSSQPFHLRGVPDDQVGIEVKTELLVDRTIAAIRAQRTQWSYTTMGDDRALAESLRSEPWVIVWPPRNPGSPILGDLFEGL